MKYHNERSAQPQVVFSIVTVVKNNVGGLQKTIASLNEQDFLDWELIVVVGRSADGSESEALSSAEGDPRKTVIKQDGQGIYQAMNLGLENAVGRFVWFMNSGDVFFDSGTLSYALQEISRRPAEILVGGYSYQNDGLEFSYSKRSKSLRPSEISLNRRGLCHQSVVYDAESLRRVGGYDTVYNLSADFHSVLQISIFGNVYRTDRILSKIEVGGVSQLQLDKVLSEKQRSRIVVFGKLSMNAVLGLLWTKAVKIKVAMPKSSRVP